MNDPIYPWSTVQFFKLKVCLTFDELIFTNISPFAVGSGGRGIEN